jgi:tRNA(Ile2) C34 agmatinyltransferase TiaS
MTPVTTRRRGAWRVDGRRRQSAGRGAGPLPTLFDPAPAGTAVGVDPAAVRVAASTDAAAGGVQAGDRAADVSAMAGSGETLDRLVVGSWERLASRAEASCLLCGGTMEPSYGAHATPIGGRCRDCGTSLS